MKQGGQISVARERAIATITLANPARLNAMTRAMWRSLRTEVEALNRESGLRCVVLRGAQGQFCAGGDISEYPAFRFDSASLRVFHEEEVWGALQALLDCPMPLVAQIEGACMGAGLEIASCCDIRLAGRSSRFGAPIARLGFPMAPREAALVRGAVGDVLARDMLFTAAVHEAARLYDAGFLLHVLADEAVAPQARACAQRIATLAPGAARLNKRTLRALGAHGSCAEPLPQALLAGAYDYAPAQEHREGIHAFLGKREPRF